LDLAVQLQLILLMIMFIVLLLELWIMKKRKKVRYATKRTRSDEEEYDEAYNAISATEKIAGVLRVQGVDTAGAEAMLVEAKTAHARGNGQYALAKANSARAALMDAKRYSASSSPARPTKDLLSMPSPDEPGPLQDGPAADADVEPDQPVEQQTQKLPDNYLQSKFMIATAEDSLREAASKGRGTSAAQGALTEARQAFGRAEYGKALSLALKARKMAEGLSPSAVAKDGGPCVTDIGAPSSQQDIERWKAESPHADVSPSQEGLSCPGCQASVEPSDAFCRKCGIKLEFVIACQACGVELDQGDAFCRKCGTKIV
jgi:hypothetical protein